MMELVKKYSGVVFFYLVVVAMVLLVNVRFDYLQNEVESETYAISK